MNPGTLHTIIEQGTPEAGNNIKTHASHAWTNATIATSVDMDLWTDIQDERQKP